MQLSEQSLGELARVHGYDVPMFPNDVTADKNIRALASVIADVDQSISVPVASNYEVAGELKTVILLEIDNWTTPVYFDKWGFVAHNLSTTLPDQASLAETFAYVTNNLKV